ncbi:hypothetical protein BU24DRAFT_419704 [Aaosphaeria arxii CBS 175.79]|uniref:Uncharacterized protein n=1 Tax=Aaosphaeria arxii CBS 175.79 TaxID=1450172 RepID=A0A6A5Y3L4_9PLEO|nr:uncharacterized protein BU24DRAFT_419704 [Aaosphaeria arxii CBS 175.79]KAF2020132.1 hypothetical protein BU24DRAFT_419704 [Aaosphaeria arxii CBS 175.79]
MEGVQDPEQATAKQGREKDKDQKQQKRLEVPTQDGRSVLPVFNAQNSPQPAPLNGVVVANAPEQENPNGTLRRRLRPSKQATERESAKASMEIDAGSKNKKRKEEIIDILKPISDGDDIHSYSILVCWGRQGHCQILPVKIAYTANDVAVWQELRRVWYAQRGFWRSLLPFLSARVEVVEISITGRGSPGTAETTFIGTYRNDHLSAEESRLRNFTANYVPQGNPSLSERRYPYNQYASDYGYSYDQYQRKPGCRCHPSAPYPSEGIVRCGQRCRSLYSDIRTCPGQEWCDATTKLLRFQMRWYLSLAFSCPNIAAGNDLLDAEDIALSEQDILSKLESEYCPSLVELQFRGLMISEGLDTGSRGVALSLGATVLFVIVVAARLIFGDWGTAWNVGSFFVALATLAWMKINHSVGPSDASTTKDDERAAGSHSV